MQMGTFYRSNRSVCISLQHGLHVIVNATTVLVLNAVTVEMVIVSVASFGVTVDYTVNRLPGSQTHC